MNCKAATFLAAGCVEREAAAHRAGLSGKEYIRFMVHPLPRLVGGV